MTNRERSGNKGDAVEEAVASMLSKRNSTTAVTRKRPKNPVPVLDRPTKRPKTTGVASGKDATMGSIVETQIMEQMDKSRLDQSTCHMTAVLPNHKSSITDIFVVEPTYVVS